MGWLLGGDRPQQLTGVMDDAEKKNSEWSVACSCSDRPGKRGVKLEKERMKKESRGEGGEEAGKNREGKSMTGNLGICRTEIGSHLDRLSQRKADFTADGSAVAALQTTAQPGMRRWSYSYCWCRPANTITLNCVGGIIRLFFIVVFLYVLY